MKFKCRLKGSNTPLNGAILTRGDSVDLVYTNVEPNQDGATLKFTAITQEDYPNGAPLIIKLPADILVTISGNVLKASFTILPDETSFLFERTVFVYDIERTIPSDGLAPDKITTLEKGTFYVDPDVTPS